MELKSALVVRQFGHSMDGIRVDQMEVGDLVDVRSDLYDGLLAEGYIQAIEALPPGEAVDIPDNWRELHHLKIIAIGKRLSSEVKSRDEAIQAIEAALTKA